MKNILSIALVLLFAGMLQAFAGDDTSKEVISGTTAPSPQAPAFRKGANDVQLVGGAMFSFQDGNRRNRPQLNYAIEALRYGWIVDEVHGPTLWYGNEEVLVEGFGGEVFKGPHGGFGGMDLILRHNFVPSLTTRFIPYIQAGAGGLGNDIFHDTAQSRIGEEFEFTLLTSAGLRYLITDHLGISAEGGYRHISNAGLSSRNSGLDSFGGALVLNYSF